MPQDIEQTLLGLNQRLLDAIAAVDWKTYQDLCDPSLTAFEPEACGQLVDGLAFHQFYFKLGPGEGLRQTTMAGPRVRILGDTAVLAYVRLNQRQGPGGELVTHAFEETRIWHQTGGQWRHVHFHRSRLV